MASGVVGLAFLLALGVGAGWFARTLWQDRRATIRAAVASNLERRGCSLRSVWARYTLSPARVQRPVRVIVDFTDREGKTWTVRCDVLLGADPLVEWLGPVPGLIRQDLRHVVAGSKPPEAAGPVHSEGAGPR